MRTIRVTGKGQLKVHPDMTRITITLEGTGQEYDATLKKSSGDTEKLKDLLVLFGFEASDLKTLSFDVAMSSLKPEFRLSYTVKDPEAVKNELLGKAVKDAVSKAEVLSSAAGLKLGEIQNMDYSWGRVDFEIQPMDKCLALCQESPITGGASYDLDIEPDDIDVQDTVTVVWEIA